MANVFKDIFDKTRKFTEVIFQQDKPLVDWELNEAQKIQRGTTEDIAKAIMSGAVSVGAGARVTPATASRAVDVAAGTVIAPTGEIMSVTAVTDLAVFFLPTTLVACCFVAAGADAAVAMVGRVVSEARSRASCA